MIGRTVSHFKIQARIGAGGMGEVYRAVDLRLGRTVALKFLAPTLSQESTARSRFLQEAQTISKLDHRHICTVYDIDETGAGTQFIVMAYYEGETLAHKIRRSPVAVTEAVAIASQVAAGLHAAHRYEIVHRDVKPSNIMVTADGEVKILDFGIARLSWDGQALDRLGTLAYMAPEQVRRSAVSPRSDIWSLGVVLYEMLTCSRPFRGATPEQLATAIVNARPVRISDLPEAGAERVNEILQRALAKNPQDRYRTAQELQQHLEVAHAEVTSPDHLPTDPAATMPAAAPGGQSHETGPEPSIAVLPFRDLSSEQDQDYFCRGVAEELIFLLTRVPGLRVVSWGSALQSLEENDDSRSAGQRLGVANVLEGSLRKSGDRLRITVRLIQVSENRYLWSERFERKLADLFEIQDEIAQTIASALEVNLIGEPPVLRPEVGSQNLEAHNLYLKGRFHWNRRDAENLKQAIDYFQQAIDEEPRYSPAYAGLADSYGMLGVYGALPPAEVMPKAREATELALAIEDSLPEVFVSRALVKAHHDWDFAGAESDFQRALELDPHYATAHQQYAMTCLIPAARFESALFELHRAQQLDPLSMPIKVSLGLCSYFAGRYDEAATAFDEALRIDDSFIRVRVFLGEVYIEQGDLEEALVEVLRAEELAARGPTVLSALGRIYARLGYRNRAGQLLNRLLDVSAERYVTPTLIAQSYLAFGETSFALEALAKAVDSRSADLIWLGVHPVYRSLHDRPEFQTLLERLGLEPSVASRPTAEASS